MSSDDDDDLQFAIEDLKISRPNKPVEPIGYEHDLEAEEDLELLEIHNYSRKQEDKVGIKDFKVISVIGKGAYGKVFLVQKHNSEKLYAMKVLKKATIVVHGSSDHHLSERSILEAISHPFIVKLHFAFQTSTRLYLILTYASGGELFSFLHTEKMFNDDQARFYISELLLGLEHLHELGIIYRDLKPENVMLDKDGHLLLTDFGLSKVAIDAQSVCGTVEFMAPEILEERHRYGKEVDYWSLGVMLYDMVVGSPPFTGGNRKKIMENVLKKKPIFPNYITQDTRDLCTKLLKKNPKVRLGFKGAAEIKKHLFFKKINWEIALQRGMVPPFVPKLENPLDTSNFAIEFTTMPKEDSPTNLTTDAIFKGFSYVDLTESPPS